MRELALYQSPEHVDKTARVQLRLERVEVGVFRFHNSVRRYRHVDASKAGGGRVRAPAYIPACVRERPF